MHAFNLLSVLNSSQSSGWRYNICLLAFGGAFSLITAGCEDTSYRKATASVSGTVTFNGQPVTFGEVTFSPLATGADSAKSAAGSIDPQGQFTMGTYRPGDGAVIGMHRVLVSSSDPAKKLPGKSPKDLQLEVKAGSNSFEIQLDPLK